MIIIAVAGRKGGIGKSTIAGNLAGEFAAMKKSVLLLDADPQHSLAAWAAQSGGVLSRCTEKIEDGAPEELKARVKKIKDVDIVVIDTPPGMPETAYAAAMVSDLMLLPCGPSPLDLFALKEVLALALKARAQRRSKKPRIRLVPSKFTLNTNLGRGLSEKLENMGRKVLPGISQRVILAEAVDAGMTISEFAPSSPSHAEFQALAKAALKVTH
jgi:chromosome partitioning protein